MEKMKEKHRSKPFKATRKQHSDEAAEDYTELISEIIDSHGEARTCHIADNLGISHVTAIRTMRRLQNEGYLVTAPHKPVVLTPKGKKLAELSKKRHKLLVEFLCSLGVPTPQAELDVEGMEHHISSVSLECIERFMKR